MKQRSLSRHNDVFELGVIQIDAMITTMMSCRRNVGKNIFLNIYFLTFPFLYHTRSDATYSKNWRKEEKKTHWRCTEARSGRSNRFYSVFLGQFFFFAALEDVLRLPMLPAFIKKQPVWL